MTIFVDTAYWVARIDKRDQWRAKAKEVTKQLSTNHWVTTELVLVEVLNYFSGYRTEVRQEVVNLVQNLLIGSNMKIIWQTQELFISGLTLYEARLDKSYSLTDCVSMIVMRQESIQDVLTQDRHFAQEGFTILL